MQNVRLYADSDPGILSIIEQTRKHTTAKEIWIELHRIPFVNTNNEIFESCDRIIIYDCFHSLFCIDHNLVNKIKSLQQIAPVLWISTHKILTNSISTLRWDFLWNRTKLAYLHKILGWKQGDRIENFEQYPLNWTTRSKKYLQLYARPEPYREQLTSLVRSQDGYWSDVNQGIFLQYNCQSDSKNLIAALPQRKFLDDSYISCQVESTYRTGFGIGFTEKTYDHLIQGRLVLNFGPKDYYKTLQQDGWALPVEIDLSWDSIADDDTRFLKYKQMLQNLLSLNLHDIHDLFVANKKVIEYNYAQLHSKPLDNLVLPD